MTKKNEPTESTRRTVLAGTAGLAAVGVVASAQAQSESQQVSEFAGKCAFVTGGARGIGFACAEELAKGGANIVLYDVAEQIDHVKYPLATTADLASAKSRIEDLGVDCMVVQGDVRDRTKLERAMSQAVQDFGSVDFLVVNAGITQTGVLDEFTDDEVQTVMDINLGGSIKTIQAALPIMREQNSGRIVLMASVTGRMGSDTFPVYASTKWGVIGLTKSTALLMAKHNVTCNAVCPTLVHTKLLDNDYVLSAISPDNPTFEAFNEAAKAMHAMPVGFYEPIRVGQAVKFFFSNDAELISGEVFDIGAGSNARFNA